MIQFLVCVGVVIGFFTVLQGDDASLPNPSLKDLHEQRCELLSEDLIAIQKNHANGNASTSSLDEAKIRLILAEAEAANNEATRQLKRVEAINLLRIIVDRSQKQVEQGVASPASYRDAQVRLIETQISFHTGG